MAEEPVVPPTGAETTEPTAQEPAIEPEPTQGDLNEPVTDPTPPATEPPKKTAQQRIDEITRARREAEREAAYWRKVALEKEEQTKTPSQPSVEPVLGLPARPALSQFQTTEEYEDAVVEWKLQKREAEQAAAKQRTEQEEAVRKFNRSAEKLREEHEDFDEVIEAPVFSQDMRIILLSSDNGPALAYHLGRPENRDLADKIRNLPARQQIYELGKLETQILLAAKTKKVPAAPAPITPVGGSGTGASIDESKLTDDEWFALEKKRTRERLESKFKGG